MSELSVYVYNGTQWLLACDAGGNVQPDGDGWMVPNSRVNRNDLDPIAIELQVYHFARVQAGKPVPANTGGTLSGRGGSGGHCFIATASYGSSIESHVKIFREFRDRFLLKNSIGQAFVSLYYTYSPPIADFIADHDNLREVARLGLLPFVGLSWIILKTG